MTTTSAPVQPVFAGTTIRMDNSYALPPEHFVRRGYETSPTSDYFGGRLASSLPWYSPRSVIIKSCV